MGMTLWLHTLEGRSMSQESDDHSLMHRFADDLDALCAEKGLPAFSSFFDFTDLNFNMNDEIDEDSGTESDDGDDDEPIEDPETGLAYGIDDMQWFDASTGLNSLKVLRDAVQAGAIAKLKPAQRSGLVEELDNCVSLLEAPSKNAGKFHLAVVM
jgi:hypothetical protein